ncbi:sigma-70 family RNA polymerase sigma factor [Candidatus Binatia bacterium]|nr:sigma-70 family RNA polymerase sigma factor [Candidatus Binatia bacterium]
MVGALRAGDRTAFETLVRRQTGPLLAVARRILSSEDDARDAVQEAFVSAWRGIAGFDGTARLSTWLHRIVVNAALMKLRSRRRRPEESIDDLLPCFDENGAWTSGMAQQPSAAEAHVASRQTRALVQRCIARLPDAYRVVLVLRDIEDRDTGEVAETLGVSPNAVKIRLHRARQALRTLLERERAVELLPSRGAAAASTASRTALQRETVAA